jgi:hypothetical protein
MPRYGVCAILRHAQDFELAALHQSKHNTSGIRKNAGWGGRIRTYGTCYQKALPYRLATPHQRGIEYDEDADGSSPSDRKNTILLERRYAAGLRRFQLRVQHR